MSPVVDNHRQEDGSKTIILTASDKDYSWRGLAENEMYFHAIGKPQESPELSFSIQQSHYTSSSVGYTVGKLFLYALHLQSLFCLVRNSERNVETLPRTYKSEWGIESSSSVLRDIAQRLKGPSEACSWQQSWEWGAVEVARTPPPHYPMKGPQRQQAMGLWEHLQIPSGRS